MEVDLACPAWLTNGLTVMATIVSPDGPLRVTSLDWNSNRVYLQLPPVTNYLSVILQPPPALSVSQSAGMVIITWPVSATGFVLQETSALPGGWTNSTAAVTVQGSTNVVNITPTGTKFYRLQQ
jgi:hypothetical protein